MLVVGRSVIATAKLGLKRELRLSIVIWCDRNSMLLSATRPLD